MQKRLDTTCNTADQVVQRRRSKIKALQQTCQNTDEYHYEYFASKEGE